MTMRWKLIAVFILGHALLGCRTADWREALEVTPTELGEVKTASQFGDEVYFGSQPEAADFPLLAAKGIRTVLNLRTEVEMAEVGFDEAAAAHEAGMHYLNIPIGREQPDEGTLELIHSIIDDETRRPLLIHCASSNRVGYVWATYRGKRGDLSADEALEEGGKAGMRSPILQQWVRSELEDELPVSP